ncbi:MAG: sigma-70 family RNA polymerase sigma factor, partial [Planctomycetes bacterium]|nr:sigma-70 family RNA polymerase sigma factor [Planctomycetota bacterium]
GGGSHRVALDAGAASVAVGGVDLLALDEALEQLDRLNDRHRRVVELRFFGGLQIQEVAHLLGVSPETVKSDWRTARAWLRTRLAP